MADKTDVGFVNAHAEGVRGHHDACITLFPCFLFRGSQAGIHPCVVGIGFYFIEDQELGHLLGFFSLPYINQPGSFHPFGDTEELSQFVFGFPDHISQVGALERTLENIASLAKEKLFLDVFHYLGGCRGGKCYERNIGK